MSKKAGERMSKKNIDLYQLDTEVKGFQQQLDELVVEGDSSVEAAQARVDQIGNTYATLKQRLDEKEIAFAERLMDKASMSDLNSVTAQLDDTDRFFDGNFEVGGGVKGYFKTQLDLFKSSIDKSKLNIGFITDLHYEEKTNHHPYSPLSLSHVLNITEISSSLDLIVAGGDNINSEERPNVKRMKRLQDFSDLLITRSKCDVLIAKGNHDDGGHLTSTDIVTDAHFQKHFRTKELLFGEVRDNGSLYSYKDYPNEKVRVIVIDTNDVPFIVDNGVLRYAKLNTFAIRNEQLNWMANNAFQVPSNDWAIIIFGHAPLSGTFGMSEVFYNSDGFTGLMQAFKNGTNYSFTYSENNDFAVNVSSSFSGSGKIIAYVNGHQHDDKLVVYNGINHIESLCSLCNMNLDSNRVVGTVTEDAWDVFEIDSANRSVNVKRFGAGNNRNFNY